MAAALKARLKRLLKKSEKQIPRGLSPLGMTRRKDLYGAPKGAPLQNAWQMPFFSSLFSRALSKPIYETSSTDYWLLLLQPHGAPARGPQRWTTGEYPHGSAPAGRWRSSTACASRCHRRDRRGHRERKRRPGARQCPAASWCQFPAARSPTGTARL